MDHKGHTKFIIKDISTSQEPPASSKTPSMSFIFESVLDAFKLNNFNQILNIAPVQLFPKILAFGPYLFFGCDKYIVDDIFQISLSFEVIEWWLMGFQVQSGTLNCKNIAKTTKLQLVPHMTSKVNPDNTFIV